MPRPRLHLFLVPAAALIAVLPLLVHGVSCGHDIDFHLLSWMEAARQFSHGTLHPHWATTPAFDAGEPRFVFYPPISWSIGGLLTLALAHLPGVAPPHTFAFAPVIYTWIALTAAGLALFSVARRYVNPTAASVAATLYLANPYTLFTAYERSAFAELLAAAWIPLLLGAILPSPSRRRPAVTAIALPVALLWLTNAPAAVMGCYALALVAATRILLEWFDTRDLRACIRLALATSAGTLLGLSLAGFYLVPAAYERRWVQISMAILPGMRIADNTLFHQTDDPIHDAVLRAASLLAVVLLAVASAAIFASHLRQRSSPRDGEATSHEPRLPSSLMRGLTIALAVLTAVIAVALTPISAPLWNHLPELAFLQFPWRTLAILAAVAAIATASWLRHLRLKPIAAAVMALAAAAVLTASAYTAFRQGCDPEDTPEARFDLFHANTGTEPTDEYTPVTADNDALSHANPAFRLSEKPQDPQAPQTSPSPQPLEAAPAIPAPSRLDLTLDCPRTLVLNLRDFPAWRIRLNGNLVASRIPREDGLLSIPLPAGRDHVEIFYATTLDQVAGDALSCVGLLVLIPIHMLNRRNRRGPRSVQT